jgi:hypothetical protein
MHALLVECAVAHNIRLPRDESSDLHAPCRRADERSEYRNCVEGRPPAALWDQWFCSGGGRGGSDDRVIAVAQMRSSAVQNLPAAKLLLPTNHQPRHWPVEVASSLLLRVSRGGEGEAVAPWLLGRLSRTHAGLVWRPSSRSDLGGRGSHAIACPDRPF